MLISRRDHGTKALLQDATRARGRVADQAQQTLSGLADDSRTLAQTARSELGDIGREMRDQAGGKVTRTRRRTARKLNEAASAVEPGKKRRRGRPVVKGVLVVGAGWLLVSVVRKARHKADESSASEDEAGSTGTTAPSRPTSGTNAAGAASGSAVR